jgi:hypothetical protein
MYTTGIMDSGLGFRELGNHKAGNGRSYELSHVIGSTPNVTGRGTCPSQAAVRGTERINGKSPSLLITAFTSPIASSQATI